MSDGLADDKRERTSGEVGRQTLSWQLARGLARRTGWLEAGVS